MTRVAPRPAALLAGHFAGNLAVRLRAWDGSEAGPKAAPVVVLRSPRAVRRLLWRPGELGLAQAYLAGDLDVGGGLTDGLSRVWRSVREIGPAPTAPGPRRLARMALTALRLGALGPRPPARGVPQAPLRGTLHSTARDRAALSHHYDLGETVGLLEAGGLEVRSAESLREHYARTIAARQYTRETRRQECVAPAGELTARVWRLCPAGAGLAFTERRMGVDQILAVRTTPDGEAGMPATPHDWYAREARQ
ncbi:hypothetical protein OHS81_00970 [Streptomyces sp. NBC_00400]|uniref:hypothetical protein n=1 Tax=Streptomyces sp. NBC_00400 TaxID=2975737 RepID=UPI002E217371